MKQIFLTISVAALLFSCAENKLSYNIDGTWSGAADGEMVYLQTQDFSTKVITKYDSAVVKEGKFLIKGELKMIDEVDLSTQYGNATFILSENPLVATVTTREIQGKVGSIKRATIEFTGDVEQTYYKEYQRAKHIGMIGVMGIAFAYPKAVADKNQGLQDTLLQNYTSSLAQEKMIIDSLISNFTDSYTAAILMKKTAAKNDTYDVLLEKYEALTPRVKSSIIGLDLKKLVDEIGKCAVGQPAPDFRAKTPQGEDFALSSLKGKYVLIDFWASWCSPCLAEVPNVKAVYDEYNPKGFEILSVSLDEDKTKWEDAITKYELNWKHISTLKGWGCEIAKLYNVSGVPEMVLLDKEGKIISKDLRGEKLREEVSKLIDNN